MEKFLGEKTKESEKQNLRDSRKMAENLGFNRVKIDVKTDYHPSNP